MTTTTTFDSCVAEREPAGAERGGQPSRSNDPFGLAALWRAYVACRRGKRQARDTQRYESRVLDHLVSTRNALASFRWRPSRTHAFVVSFLGHCRHASATRLWRGTLARFPWLSVLFDRPEDATQGFPLRPAWTATLVSGLAGQYRDLARRHPGAWLLMQCGNRWLLAPPRTASLRRMIAPGATRVRRPGLGECLEVHPRDLPALRGRLKRAGQAHALAVQNGHYKTGFKRRELVLLWRPADSPDTPLLLSSSTGGTL